MSNFDLDINNYNYNELLQLFKLNINDPRDVFFKEINNKLKSIKQNNINNDIYKFFNKCKQILLCIYDLLTNNIIKPYEIDTFTSKIHKLTELDQYNEHELYNKIINIEFEYNKPYYNVDRLDPNLNNKNNTNLIYNTSVNEVAPGNLNTVQRITQQLNLNLNSCFRSNYFQSNSTDFLYVLPNEIKNVTAIRLVSIEIPHNSWYLISSAKKNNIFEIIIYFDDKTYEYKIEVPEGNYNSEEMERFLNTNYFCESGVDTYLKYIQFTINHNNLKSSFELIEDDNNEQPKMFFSLKFAKDINQNMINTFGWILGFRVSNYLNITTKITSEGIFDTGNNRYIYVSITDFQYNSNDTNIICFDKSTLNEDVIAKIPMINDKLSIIINDNNSALSKIRKYNGPINLSKLQIKLLDVFGNIIDLNYMDFSMTIEIQTLYENFNFKNITC